MDSKSAKQMRYMDKSFDKTPLGQAIALLRSEKLYYKITNKAGEVLAEKSPPAPKVKEFQKRASPKEGVKKSTKYKWASYGITEKLRLLAVPGTTITFTVIGFKDSEHIRLYQTAINNAAKKLFVGKCFETSHKKDWTYIAFALDADAMLKEKK